MALDELKLYFKVGDFDENINISEGLLVASICHSTKSLNIYPGQSFSVCFVPNFRAYFAFCCSISKLLKLNFNLWCSFSNCLQVCLNIEQLGRVKCQCSSLT